MQNSLSDSHSSSNRDVESGKLLVLVEDRNVTEIVTVDIDIIGRRNSDSDLELSGLLTKRAPSQLQSEQNSRARGSHTK